MKSTTTLAAAMLAAAIRTRGINAAKTPLQRGLIASGVALAAALAPAAADERNAFQSAGLVTELKAGLATAEARIEELEKELLAAAVFIRDLNAGFVSNRNRIKELENGLNEVWGRILRLEAGNPEWIEKVEAEERKFRRELQEARERLRNAPRGKTLNELFRVGEPRRARPAVGYDEVPLPDTAVVSP